MIGTADIFLRDFRFGSILTRKVVGIGEGINPFRAFLKHPVSIS